MSSMASQFTDNLAVCVQHFVYGSIKEFYRWIPLIPGGSPHKRPVTRKAFPCQDVIMGSHHTNEALVPYVTTLLPQWYSCYLRIPCSIMELVLVWWKVIFVAHVSFFVWFTVFWHHPTLRISITVTILALTANVSAVSFEQTWMIWVNGLLETPLQSTAKLSAYFLGYIFNYGIIKWLGRWEMKENEVSIGTYSPECEAYFNIEFVVNA